MSKGVIYFAFNNREIDYWFLASLSSLTVKDNLGVPVCLVTTKGTHDYAVNKFGTEYTNKCFDEVITLDDEIDFIQNNKVYRDGRWKNKSLPYYNSMQTKCYEYTPFDETILLDADYLVFSDNLNNCWGSQLDFMVNYYSYDFGDEVGYKKTQLNDRGMNTLWSTCVYFRKSDYMDCFFDLVSYIKNHWKHYYSLYGIKTKLYRNDYVFTIAHHILNGYIDVSDKNQMPVNGIHVLNGINDVYAMSQKNELITFLEIPNEKGNYILGNISGIDVHIQNKWSIGRISDSIRRFYE